MMREVRDVMTIQNSVNPGKYRKGFKRDLHSLACRATTPGSYTSRYSSEMAKIVPPINFGLVEDGKLFDPEQF